MARRSLKTCTFCGPDVTSVGKYYLPPSPGCESGWMAVCDDCANTFKRYHQIEYFAPRADVIVNSCSHVWNKKSLVTQPGGYDEMVCTKCGQIGHRHGVGREVQPVLES